MFKKNEKYDINNNEDLGARKEVKLLDRIARQNLLSLYFHVC